MLVLISGGIAAYAQNQSFSPVVAGAHAPLPMAASTNSTTTTSTSTGSTSTTTSTGSTSTSSSTSTVTTTVTKTVTSTASTTTANNTLCQPPTTGVVGRLVLPITQVGSPTSGSISFSNSRGCIASVTAVGGIFSVSIVLNYAKPVTEYNVVLVANGTSYTLGSMVTDQRGSGSMSNQVLLATGKYTVSIEIFDVSSTPGQSILVLQTGEGTIVCPPFPSAAGGQSGQQPNQPGNHR